MNTFLLSMGLATGAWFTGWVLDVSTTVRGLLRTGRLEMERNPLARWLLRKLGTPGAFATLLLLESSVVAAHWGVARLYAGGPAEEAALVGAAGSLVVAGIFHALAAHANHTGRPSRVLLPILRVYEAISRSARR
jgi:hypothetical protein